MNYISEILIYVALAGMAGAFYAGLRVAERKLHRKPAWMPLKPRKAVEQFLLGGRWRARSN